LPQRDAALGEPFETSAERQGDTALIRPSGAFAAECVGLFEKALSHVFADDVARVVLDLRNVTFMDSRALSAVLATHDRCRATGSDFVVVRGTGQVQRTFELSGLDDHFTMLDEPPTLDA
jgi:anti-sigma B factor antagonist